MQFERLMGWPVWSVSRRGTWEEQEECCGMRGWGAPKLDERREIQEEGCSPHQEEGVSYYLA